jgi:hypothetical protein
MILLALQAVQAANARELDLGSNPSSGLNLGANLQRAKDRTVETRANYTASIFATGLSEEGKRKPRLRWPVSRAHSVNRRTKRNYAPCPWTWAPRARLTYSCRY